MSENQCTNVLNVHSRLYSLSTLESVLSLSADTTFIFWGDKNVYNMLWVLDRIEIMLYMLRRGEDIPYKLHFGEKLPSVHPLDVLFSSVTTKCLSLVHNFFWALPLLKPTATAGSHLFDSSGRSRTVLFYLHAFASWEIMRQSFKLTFSTD